MFVDAGNPHREPLVKLLHHISVETHRKHDPYEVVLDTVSPLAGGGFTPRLSPEWYRDADCIVFNGSAALEFGKLCDREGMISPDATLIEVSRTYSADTPGHAETSFDRRLHHVSNGRLYPRQTMEAAFTVFPDRRTLVLVGDEDDQGGGALNRMLRSHCESFVDDWNADCDSDSALSFVTIQGSQLEQIFDASRKRQSLRISSLIGDQYDRPIILYGFVWLQGSRYGLPIDYLRDLHSVFKSEEDAIPIATTISDFVQPDAACISVGTTAMSSGDEIVNILLGKQAANSITATDNAVLYCEPNRVLDLAGVVPNDDSSWSIRTDQSEQSTSIEIEHVVSWSDNVLRGNIEELKAQNNVIDKQRIFAILVSCGLALVLVSLTLQTYFRIVAERKLVEQNRLVVESARSMTLGTFCTALAHDLSHPLASILNNTDAALRLSNCDSADVLPTLREILRDINKDNERAGVVLERIVNIVRSGSIRIVPTDPDELLRQVDGIVASRVAQAGVRLECSSIGQLPKLAADPVLLQMMILNVIDNAVTALSRVDDENQSQQTSLRRPQIQLKISLCPQDCKAVCITISDNGPGLRDYTAEQFLEPLFSTSPNGLGLGLSIVKSLAEQQRGTLEIKPNVPQGLVVTLKMPLWSGQVDESDTSLSPVVHVKHARNEAIHDEQSAQSHPDKQYQSV